MTTTAKMNEFLGFCGYVQDENYELMYSSECMSSAEAIEEAEEIAEFEYHL